MGQLSFYSAEARQPCVGDLAGLLCGPGQALGFARGRAARVSVGADTRDRAVAVAAALAERGVQARVEAVRVEAEPEPAPEEPAGQVLAEAEDEAADEPVDQAADEPVDEPVDPAVDELVDEADGFAPVVIGSGRSRPTRADAATDPGSPDPGAVAHDPVIRESWLVTTAFRTDLAGLAAQWLDGDRKVVPPDFTLDGGALRLWALASGRWVESGSGYLLGLDPEAPDTHETLRKALATSGLPSTLLTGKAGGPALRVAGRRRLERLAELVGRAPSGVAGRTWPAA